MKKTALHLFLLFLLCAFNNVSSQQIIMVKDTANDGTIRFAQVSEGIKPLTSKKTKDFLINTLKSEAGVDFPCPHRYAIKRTKVGARCRDCNYSLRS